MVSSGAIRSGGGSPFSLEVAGVSFAYANALVLREFQLLVRPGECVALMGPSGCGKSTLLLVAGGVLAADQGTVAVNGELLSGSSVDRRAAIRRRHIGLVFQFGELVAELSLLENVALAAELAGLGRRAAVTQSRELLSVVGLEAVAGRRPAEVSGGQAQRAAVARALVHRPALVLADEPTGALDRANASMVLDVLIALAADVGAGVVIATHDETVAARCATTVRMLDGQIVHGRNEAVW